MFVRTKSGIYDLEIKDNKNINYYQIDDDFEEETYGGKTGRVLYIPSKAVLKQSDNLAELCDGFYIDVLGDGAFNFDGLYVYNDFDDFKEHYISYHNYDDVENGYGFIKTNKGLQFVTCMNNKGELELL